MLTNTRADVNMRCMNEQAAGAEVMPRSVVSCEGLSVYVAVRPELN